MLYAKHYAKLLLTSSQVALWDSTLLSLFYRWRNLGLEKIKWLGHGHTASNYLNQNSKLDILTSECIFLTTVNVPPKSPVSLIVIGVYFYDNDMSKETEIRWNKVGGEERN